MSPKTKHNTETSIKVGGFTPLTTIDYPDQLAAVVFCQGCPWRCRYCHNKELIKRNQQTFISWKDIANKIEQRSGLLDAVVFSGGEPTLQPGLENAVRHCKNLGFKIGLHTAGCYPEKLEKLLPVIDWIGLDIKALKNNYAETTGVSGSGQKAWKSLQLLLESDANFEVRVTVHSDILPEPGLMDLLQNLADMGIQNLALQQCVSTNTLDQSLGINQSYLENSECVNYAKNHFNKLILRTF